ncbi:hypothetical protein CASFOL_005902 [Castilleja foliolosa]|uniref:Phospholipase/carboxylesterase/thioesterase domain-containing protein n=1 Tax=Castilleja foliolosa TaxID=1961234 RepID=A0ABD3E5S5_9LAMI
MAQSFVLWLHGLGDSGPANEPIKSLFTSPPPRPASPASFHQVAHQIRHGAFLVTAVNPTLKGEERADFASEAILVAALRTAADRKTDLAAVEEWLKPFLIFFYFVDFGF